jgi:hypothetical protein
LFASASGTPGDALDAPAGDNALEDTIAPPIWRRVESLIEEHRAANLALTGEALGEAALIEPVAPIWRGVSALRIEVAEIEGAPESAGQETVWEHAPQPPIWRRGEPSGHAGSPFALASLSALSAEREDEDLVRLPRISTAPPIWTSWLSGAWPEAHAPSVSEETTDIGARSIRSELPIWRTMRQS